MLDLSVPIEKTTTPFTMFRALRVLDPRQVRELYESAPVGLLRRIETASPRSDKQYRMSILNLADGRERCPTPPLAPAWKNLLDELLSPEFTRWLAWGTGLTLAGLPLDVSVYGHVDGDFISVHLDKQNKALTCVLYLNEEWSLAFGGMYEAREGPDPKAEPACLIRPVGGLLLGFQPTSTSWHSVSPVTAEARAMRLTVQCEFWNHKDDSHPEAVKEW